jgi:4-amino-4-deoxy-L-arabinose transferase-like glycosyltransferase
MNFKPRYYSFLALATICLGAGLRLIGLSKGIWMDEYYAIEIARSNHLIPSLQTHDYMPLYFFLLKLWASLNTSEPYIRLFSVIWGVLTIVLIMKWLNPISPQASLLAGVLCATNPGLIRYSQEIQTYSLLIFFVALSFYCADKILSHKDSVFWYFALSTSLVATVITHMVGIMMIASICIYLLPYILENRTFNYRSGIKLLGAIFIPIVVFGLAYNVFAGGGKEGNWWMPPLSVELLISQFKLVFGVQALLAPTSILSQYSLAWSTSYAYAICLFLLILVVCLTLGIWRISWPFFAAATTYWGQIILYSWIFLPIFWYRTILPGLIPLLGFIGIQATSTPKRGIRLLTVSGISLVSLAFAAGWVLAGSKNTQEPIQQVAQILEAEYQTGECIAFYPAYIEAPIRYYFPTLPPESSIAIEIGAEISRTKLELRNCLRSPQDVVQPTLVLVVRSDFLLEQDRKNYDQLLAFLESSAKEKYATRDFGILSITKYQFQDE